MGGRSSDSRILAASHGAIATLARPADIVPAPSHPKTRAAVATRDDMEFLPSALEIVVTPPSPVAMWMMTVICAGILSALVWSYCGWLDIHAIANGKIQPNGRTKVVQPLEPGRVIAIHVENGARVEAGQVLLELDPTETTADREALARDLESSLAEGILYERRIYHACFSLSGRSRRSISHWRRRSITFASASPLMPDCSPNSGR